MGEIRLSYVTVSYEAPIVFFIFKDGAELGFPEIKELIACAEKLSGNTPYVTFSDVRVNMNITHEGRKYVEDLRNMPFFRGTAALVNNGAYSFAVNFMNSFGKKAYPFKAFTKKDKALAWLRSLKRE